MRSFVNSRSSKETTQEKTEWSYKDARYNDKRGFYTRMIYMSMCSCVFNELEENREIISVCDHSSYQHKRKKKLRKEYNFLIFNDTSYFND